MSSDPERVFKFKQFSLTDKASAMKIGMDAVLLGAFSAQTDFENALDIGCGCGILSLMIAQKGLGSVYAIDIDEGAAAEAAENFRNSPWAVRLNAENISIQAFAEKNRRKFDKIICNPPYFQNSLKSQKEGRNLARHNQSLTFFELARAVARLISPNGHFDVILPFESAEEMEKSMGREGLNLHSQMLIRNRAGEKPIRVIQHYTANEQMGLKCNSLVIFDAEGTYSYQFTVFTKEYYL